MTELLRKAFEEASKLSADEQDAIAAAMLEELAAETKWPQTLATSESRAMLRELAEEALDEHRAGHTRKLNPDHL